VRTRIGHGVGQIFKILINVPRSDVVYCWFASVYAFVAVLVASMFGVKSVIVLGGVDIAKNPALDYGIWLSPWKSKLVRSAITRADRVFVSDETMREDAMRLVGYSGNNIFYLPPAFDTEFWKPVGEKEQQILTVAIVPDQRTMKRKGIDVLIETARILSEFTFIVVGVDRNQVLHLHPPENIRFHPILPRKELLHFYQKAKVYCQPSIHEALCYTLREAMLCGCIPVASDTGGMPTAVRGIGVLVPPGNIDMLVVGIMQAMKQPEEVGLNGRSRVAALYAKEKRETELLRYIEGLIS
jgi:glycosyltransferase involved in cell wall biosynthesis